MQNFEFILKNEKLKSYNKISLSFKLIYLAAIFFFIWREHNLISLTLSIVLVVLLAAGLLINYFSKPLLKQQSFIKSIAWDVIAGVAFIVIFKYYWFAFAIILIGVFEFLATRKLKIFFFSEKIQLDFFIRKNIDWQQLNNAILKDRLITIDFKNDRLIQVEIAPESYDVDEVAFNQFCQNQLQTQKN